MYSLWSVSDLKSDIFVCFLAVILPNRHVHMEIRKLKLRWVSSTLRKGDEQP
jgi:hypothetical protein